MSKNDSDTQQDKPALSKWALLSVILCTISLILAVPLESYEKPSPFLITTTIATLVTALTALCSISFASKQIHGREMAILALFVSAAILFKISLPRLNSRPQSAERLVCGAQLKGLGKKLALYADQNNGTCYPPPETWCDVLVNDYEVNTGNFLCKAAYNKGDKGPSHYAINPNCEPNSPPDTVLLFEAKGGWNQHGGLELLTLRRHGGRRHSKGGSVLFNNGRVEWCNAEWIAKMNWNGEEPNNTSVKEE
jgi:hypothetical protein